MRRRIDPAQQPRSNLCKVARTPQVQAALDQVGDRLQGMAEEG
jgi:hypothetical protein